jgi:hypothetical protein
MNIRIDSLSVNGLGPIATIKWPLKAVNLIYGKNEQGKTFLVEYLLRSLFKKAPNTRSLTDSGQVIVSGLGDEIVTFTPKSRKKIDDYLLSGDGEYLVDLSRLCVVKGGDTSFIPYSKESISKDVLKEYLSDQRTLDAIVKGIPSTTQESTWENGQIIPKRHVGSIKELDGTHQSLKNIDERLQELDESFALGELKKLKGELDVVSKTVEDQLLARRFYAYTLAEQIKKQETALMRIPNEKLEEAKSLNVKLGNKNNDIERTQLEINTLEPECAHIDWLKTALEECEKRPVASGNMRGTLFMILTIIGIVITTLSALAGLPGVALVTGLLSILFLVLTVNQYRSRLKNISDDVEVARIFEEYEDRFGEKGQSIAALKSKYENLSKKYGSLQTYQEQLGDHQRDKEALENSLQSILAQLDQENKNPEEFSKIISVLQEQRNQLTSDKGDLSNQLAATQLQPDEYLPDNIETVYDPKILHMSQEEKLAVNDSIYEIQCNLDTLKQRVCDITNDPISTDWDELIDHLRSKREEISQRTKELKAQIGSGIIISQVISDMRNREDESITRALVSPLMQQPLQAITHNYDGVELDGNELIAYNKSQRYPVSELSTGAQEQVLLALRIGIAAHVLSDRKMFMILDDAFQHSDWERRAWLVDEMVDLANIGWQIIYFSMDDHIKGLFEERIKPVLKDQYQTLILQS